MNWINNLMRPKIRSFLTTKREVPDNLWRTCPLTGQMVFHKDLEANQFVFPGSDYHERMSARARLEHLFDDEEFSEVAVPDVPVDPLKFRDSKRYTDRLKEARAKTGLTDAVLVGEGTLDGLTVVAAVQDFDFMAGSLGMAAGEALISGMLQAVQKKAPFVLFAASGGARMQEGILSLMQMPRTTIAVQRLRDARLPYIVVLTNPTSGGVTASYAMLGDVHIAEPGALICFAGPRVIQQTIRENLPDGFQRSEYLFEHGMVDMVVHRHQLRETISRLCGHLMAGRDRLAEREAQKSAANGASSKTAGAKANGKDINPTSHAAQKANGSEATEPASGGKSGNPAKQSATGSGSKSSASNGGTPASEDAAGQGETAPGGKPSASASGENGATARGSKGAT